METASAGMANRAAAAASHHSLVTPIDWKLELGVGLYSVLSGTPSVGVTD